jgi:hypothetical protein
MALLVISVVLSGCTASGAGSETTGTEHAAPSPTVASEPLGAVQPGQARAPCPRRGRNAEALAGRAVPPTSYRPAFAATLCRYRYRDGFLRLVGQPEPVRRRLAEELWHEFTRRSLGMVDCEWTPELGLYAVLDRNAAGEARVVTVDLGLCASIEGRVPGPSGTYRTAYGLATRRHVGLLQRLGVEVARVQLADPTTD